MFYFLISMQAQADTNIVESITGVEKSIFGNIINIIRIVGSGLALIMLAWMSISYFAADGRGFPGSIEKKADIKGRQLMNFAIGTAVFIGASNLLYFLADFIVDIIGAVTGP